LGVLAGNYSTAELVRRWGESADRLYAADGGADLLIRAGLAPQAAIGDFDSISPAALTAVTLLQHEPDQSLSDCDKLLNYSAALGVARITLLGAEGDRIDHMIGILQSAARQSRLCVRIAYEKQLADVLVAPVSKTWRIAGGFSLLPLSPCEGVNLTGAEWDLANARLDPLGLTSLSNRAAGPVTISIQTGAAVLFRSYDGTPVWDEDR
jgi:thiamine pyrophosphokinase